MKVTLIAALGTNLELGKDNQLLWSLPADLKRFKQTTTGHCIIMGRKTFESIGKPLPNRTTIVVSRKNTTLIPGVIYVNSIHQAFLKARQLQEAHCFVVGGAQIYSLALPFADYLDITQVHGTFEADTFFPEFEPDEFKLISNDRMEPDEKNPYAYSFQKYERTSPRRKVIFLDRDGVLNLERGRYNISLEDMEVNLEIIPWLQHYKNQGFEFIIITNQGAIQKGLLAEETLKQMHDQLTSIFSTHQISFLDIYYCPHHSDIANCLCRKPKSLLLEKAMARFNVNGNESFMVGDNPRDLECAENAGIPCLLIKSNEVASLAFN